MENDRLIDALNAIAQGHALSNDLCMNIGWRTVCAKAAAQLTEKDKQLAQFRRKPEVAVLVRQKEERKMSEEDTKWNA